MASVALGAAGQGLGSLLGPFGGVAGKVAGTSLGAYIDSKWLLPLLQEEPDLSDLNEVTAQTADEGSPVPFNLGPRCRTYGQLIWFGDIEVEGELEPSKGSQGGQSTAPVIEHYRSLAIAYHFDPRIRIENVDRIIAEGKTIYRGSDQVDVSSALLYVNKREVKDWDDASGAYVTQETWMEVVSPNGGPDLQNLESGVDVVVTGFSNGGNNGTFRCLGVDVNTATGVQFARLRNSSAVTEAASGGTKTVTQDIPPTRKKYYESITFYDGSPTQEPNELIEEAEDGPVPAFRGVAYCVIEKMRLTEWAGRVPQMVIVLKESSSRTVAAALSSLLERAGIGFAEHDVSAVTGDLVGYTVRGPKSGIDTIAPLMVAYDISLRESGGKLVFFPRSAAETSDVTEAELGASDDIEAEPIQWGDSDGQGRDLPREVGVKYLDSANEMQPGLQTAENFSESSVAIETVNLGVAMSPASAKQRAHELLWARVANARTMTTTLPPSRIDVKAGELITAQGHSWMIARHSRRPDGVTEVECVQEWTGTDWSHVSAQGSPEDTVEQEMPAEHFLAISDAAPLEDRDWLNGVNGYYWGHGVLDSTVIAHNARLFHGTTAANVSRVGNGTRIGIEATCGLSETVLADAPFEYVDRANTVDVRLIHGELSSATQAEVQAGESNWCQLGTEIIGFETATLVETRVYRLSNLHRGLRGTNLRTGDHVIGERFLLLDRDTIKRIEIPQNSSGGPYIDGTAIYRMAIEAGANSNDHEPQLSVFRPGAKRSMHPYPVKGQRDLSAATLTVIWTRRVPLNGSQLPNPYHRGSTTAIQILSGPGGSVLFEESVSLPNNQATSTQRAYTSAFLTTLGLTYTNSITFTLAEQENGILSDRYEVTV